MPGSSSLQSLVRDDFVNIDQFPALDNHYKVDENAQLTLGDLHGNAKKLLYTLVRHDVFRNLNQDDYAQFIRFYNKENDAITKEDLSWFEDFLSKIEVNPLGTIRLIGDELADRGSNDYFTLRLLAKLIEKTNVDILISNHSLEFISAFEKKTAYVSARLWWGQAASMANLNQLITKGLIDRQTVDRLVSDLYLPKVKLLDCTIDEANQRIAIFSHAPIGIESVQAIAEKLGVAYKDDTLTDLAQTIEDINTTFSLNYVHTNQIHRLFDDEQWPGDPADANPKLAPFTHLIWNRNHQLNRPENYKGYKLKFIHGHDTMPTNIAHRIYNLDNALGKGSAVQGPYHVHFTHEKAFQPRIINEQEHEPSQDEPEPINQAQKNWREICSATFRGFLWAPSQYPVLTGLVTTAVMATGAILLGMTAFTLAFASVFTLTATISFTRLRNQIARSAIRQVNENTIGQQTQTVQTAFRQGQAAAQGWFPYAKTFSILNTAPWKDYGAFAAGMKSEMDKEAHRSIPSI